MLSILPVVAVCDNRISTIHLLLMIAKVGQGLSQIVFNGLGQAFALVQRRHFID
jgi:hypothetical protein